MAKQKVKTFTPHQIARLPAEGYWIENLGGKPYTFYCIKNGKVKYARNHEWSTLLWSCCPTAKAIAENRHGIQYEHFATHEEMLAAHPDLSAWVQVKAPNDF